MDILIELIVIIILCPNHFCKRQGCLIFNHAENNP
jgi:hypothetical protein